MVKQPENGCKNTAPEIADQGIIKSPGYCMLLKSIFKISVLLQCNPIYIYIYIMAKYGI